MERFILSSGLQGGLQALPSVERHKGSVVHGDSIRGGRQLGPKN